MIKSKRSIALALTAAFGLVAAGCGSDSKAATTTAATGSATTVACAPAGKLKLGVAFDTGGRGDGTFNDAAGRGADRAKCELGATVKELETSTNDDRKPNLEALTKDGNNPIVAVGFAFGDSLKEIATANPNTTYGIIDSVVDAPNVRSLVFAEQEGSFLVGAAAALKSKTGHIGFIGGQEIDLIKRFEAGYTAGAKAVNKDSDQYLTATPDQQKHILTSMLKRVDVAVFETAKAVAGGDAKGGIIMFDLKVDGVGYSTSGGYLDDVKDKLEAYKADIIAGKITVPTKPGA